MVSPSRAAAFGYPQMASFAGAARLLTLLQVALLVVSAVLMSGSAVCHGARDVGELPSISQTAPLSPFLLRLG